MRKPIGNYTEKPYIVAQTDTSVYCVEELCYVLKENAFMLDRDICDENLIQWLDKECGLPELARELSVLHRQEGSPSAMAGIILDYVAFGSSQERLEIQRLLRENTGEDKGVKRKNKGDYLLKRGKYAQAVSEYKRVLQEVPQENHGLMSEVLMHQGTAYARLFRFREAADCFYEAVSINPTNSHAAFQYLAALRMDQGEEAYLTFLSKNPQWQLWGQELDEQYAEALGDVRESEAYLELQEMKRQKSMGSATAYYRQLEEKLEVWKNEYRLMVEE